MCLPYTRAIWTRGNAHFYELPSIRWYFVDVVEPCFLSFLVSDESLIFRNIGLDNDGSVMDLFNIITSDDVDLCHFVITDSLFLFFF